MTAPFRRPPRHSAPAKPGLALLRLLLPLVLLLIGRDVRAQTDSLTTLYTFNPLPDGLSPYGGLVQGSDGNFYGTTNTGGTYSYGTIYKITPTGGLTILRSLAYSDGVDPQSNLIRGQDGNFYGTAPYGGPSGYGVVFSITPAGVFNILHAFASSDGYGPVGALVQRSDGNFYGTTAYGGANNAGTVFSLTPAGVLTILYNFSVVDSSSHNNDGAYPYAALVQGSDGNFYGTSDGGGINGYGTVFSITPAGVFNVLHSFNTADGINPRAALIRGQDGNFYGTTEAGGTNNSGSVFSITPAGGFNVLYSFTYSIGSSPSGTLLQGSDGTFYGTTVSGGPNGYGTVFSLTPSGTLTTLHAFSFTDGASSYAPLIQGQDGNFYGTTTSGGPYDRGTVFQMTPAGAVTVLHGFGTNNAGGASPSTGLIQGTDGKFYGTTPNGGATGHGVVFSVTAAGALTTLHDFSALSSNNDNTDGANPAKALIQGTDGNFYGTTPIGGANGGGTVFSMTPTGNLTTLHAFTYSDGYTPNALIQGQDGNFYGTAYNGRLRPLRHDFLRSPRRARSPSLHSFQQPRRQPSEHGRRRPVAAGTGRKPATATSTARPCTAEPPALARCSPLPRPGC